MTSRPITRYPIQIEHAAPGKLVRTRVRHVAVSGSSPVVTGDATEAIPYLARTILPLASSFKPRERSATSCWRLSVRLGEVISWR